MDNKNKHRNSEEEARRTEEKPKGINEVNPEDVEVADTYDALDSDDQEEQVEGLEGEVLKLNEELEKQKKEYLFLMAEFDNFRKRTLKEKSELIRNAGEQVLKGLLPIIDDFERGLKAEGSEDAAAAREGMTLIYNKLVKYLEQNGVKEIDPEDREFDTEKHEAISAVPVPDEKQKGKIIDTVQKGYMLNDKVLRHAKVVVGQ